MTSKIWVESCKYSAVVGTIFGLLLPGLPLLAAPSSTLAWDLPDETQISQTGTLCPDEESSVAEYMTENYGISICQDADGNLYYMDYNSGNQMSNTLYDVTTTRDGDYIVTTYDEVGDELVYTVGDYFRVTNNGDQVVYEKTY